MPTLRQAQVLSLIKESVEARGYPPSLRELAAALKVSGTRAVEKHIQALERQGLLERKEGARALELADRPKSRGVPVVGRVAAGKPLLAEENLEGSLALDASLARWKDSFLLRVKGESMKGAGILDGDLVLVRPQAQAETGEIVVAMLEGEATVKRLQKRAGRVLLQPENPAFKPMELAGDGASILGKVVGVLRF